MSLKRKSKHQSCRFGIVEMINGIVSAINRGPTNIGLHHIYLHIKISVSQRMSMRSVAAVAVGRGSVAELATVLNLTRSGVSRENIGTISDSGGGLVAAPEGTTSTSSVAVSRGGTEALLTLVVASQTDLEKDANCEEEAICPKLTAAHRREAEGKPTYIPMMETAKTAFSRRHAVDSLGK